MADHEIIAEGVEQLAARPKQRIALWRGTLPHAVAESGVACMFSQAIDVACMDCR